MRICRDNTTYSFLTLPPSPPFDLHSDFSRTFHPTLCLRPSGPPLPPAHGIELPLIPTTRTSPPLHALHPSADKGFDPAAGSLAGDRNSGEGGNMGFLPVDDIDYGLLSCTESLGFESSDEISSLDYGSSNDSFYSSSSSSSSSSPPSSATSSSPSSPFSWCSSSKRWSEERSEKKEFPPPLTTMSENGRRNFVLRSERKDGRLEIVKMAIERPEVLYASRQNGRLTMHLVRSFPEFEEEDDVFEEEEEEEEGEGEEEKETEKEEEERETGEEEEEEEEAEEERETTAANGVEEKEEEEREWKIPTAGVRRCYQYQYHVHVWGQQQRRWVTTM